MHNDIVKALDVLHNGGVILYPTDTIWGIGCDATNPDAVKRVYDIKQRSDSKSLLVLMDNPGRLPSYIGEVPDVAWDLVEVADKPLTLIYPGAKNLAPNLIADDGSIGIRIVKHAFCEKLLQRFKKPIVSTSANISGESTPQTFDEIPETVKNQVDYIVEFEQDKLEKAKPSQIIKLGSGGEIKIIR